MSFLSGLGKIVHKVTGFVDKITSFIKSPVESLTKLIQGPLDRLVNKLPFGLGKVVQPFVDKFLGVGINWLASGPLAGVFGMLKKIAPTVETIDNVLDKVDAALNGGGDTTGGGNPGGGGGLRHLPTPALQNAQEIFSWNHAQTMWA